MVVMASVLLDHADHKGVLAPCHMTVGHDGVHIHAGDLEGPPVVHWMAMGSSKKCLPPHNPQADLHWECLWKPVVLVKSQT